MVSKKTKMKKANLRAAINTIEAAVQPSGQITTSNSSRKKNRNSVRNSGQTTAEGKPKSLTVTTPPVTIGTTIRNMPAVSKKTTNGVILAGRDFVAETSSSTGMTGGSSLLVMIPLHPLFYPGTIIGNMGRCYEKYVFRKLALHFVSRAPTSTNGELWMHQVDNINEPVLDGTSGTFNAKVLSSRTALIGPVWMNHTLQLKVDNVPRFVDAFVSTDANDNILGEVRLHATTASQVGIGVLMWDYEIEFIKPFFQLYSFPISTGPGTLYTATCTSATPTASDAFELTNTTLSALANGTILRISIDTLSSTAPTGTTFANLLKVATKVWSDSVAAVSTNTTNLSLSCGFTCYGVVSNSTDITCYATYDNAVAGTGTGGLYYQTTGSSVGSFRICAYVVRLPPAFSTYVQT